MKKSILLITIILCYAAIAFAQPRPMEKTSSTSAKQTVKRNAPSSVEARYEGGIFGYSEREKGTIKFDDENERLIFLSKETGKGNVFDSL